MANDINIRPIDSADDILSVLNEAEDYVLKIDGNKPDLNRAKELLIKLPPGLSIENKLVLGIWQDKTLIGFADVLLHYPNSTTLFIGLLVFGNEYRKAGYGSEFLVQLAEIAEKERITRMKASIVESNKDVTPFWRKNNFSSTGEIGTYRNAHAEHRYEIFEAKVDQFK